MSDEPLPITTPDPAKDVPSTAEILAELRVLVAGLPTQAEAERAIRIERELGSVARWLRIPVLASLAFIVFSAWAASTGRQETIRNRQFQACLLAQQAEHRVTGHHTHEAILNHLGIPKDPTNGTLLPAPPTDVKIRDLCDGFFPSEAAEP